MVIYFIQPGEGHMPFGFGFPVERGYAFRFRVPSYTVCKACFWQTANSPFGLKHAVCLTEASPTVCNTRPQAPQGIKPLSLRAELNQ